MMTSGPAGEAYGSMVILLGRMSACAVKLYSAMLDSRCAIASVNVGVDGGDFGTECADAIHKNAL